MDFVTGGRLEVRIDPADVGKRVSVRRLVEPAGDGARFTDCVGVLASWQDGVLAVTRRSGETVRFPESAMVAAKVVPPTPAHRRGPTATADELDRMAARGWPPPESERMGDWLLRAAAERGDPHGAAAVGFTRRANSALALGDPGMPLGQALDRVTDWYTRRGLPARVQLGVGTTHAADRLAEALTRRGWTPGGTVEFRTAPLPPIADGGHGAAAGPGVALSRTPGDGWLTRYLDGHVTPGPVARQVLTGGPSVWFAQMPAASTTEVAGATAEARRSGPPDGAPVPAAVGRCVVDGRWAGFTALRVADAFRRQGLASRVMAELARAALAEGASAAHLAVASDNTAAIALYESVGFLPHHQYQHWRAPAG